MRKCIPLLLALLWLAGCSNSSDSDGNNPPVDKSANLLVTGASANDILSGTTYTDMLVQVAYVENFRPTQAAVDTFIGYLYDRTFKQNIQVEYTQLPSPGKETLKLQEVANLESKNRTAYNKGNTLAIYIYFADAPSAKDDISSGSATLGAVYRNTSMVIYESTIHRITAESLTLIRIADVETIILKHEFGHLFGLVDLGTPEINPHEDPNAVNHCNVSGCLMEAELQFGSGIMSVLQNRAGKGSAVLGIDRKCLLDLQANGGR